MLQFYLRPAKGFKAMLFRLKYWLYLRPLHHVQFNNQDAWMVRLMPDTPPEHLYRPDASITAWRKLCEYARGGHLEKNYIEAREKEGRAMESAGAGQNQAGAWPRYDQARAGLLNYWYPVMWSGQLRRKAIAIQLCDEPIMLIRDRGKAYAFRDQCPHRGVPLSMGRREFPGTWTCRYHGWTYDINTGILKAALTDGPDSPICGKVRVKTYPVEERAGLVWLYMGNGEPPSVEADIPEEFLRPDAVILGRITIQKGNWRYACENAIDDGHGKYLHRYGVVRSFYRETPAWTKINMVADENGWLIRQAQAVNFADFYEGLGRWPAKKPVWKRRTKGNRISIRLPGISRNEPIGTKRATFAWYVPVGSDQYRYLQFSVAEARGFHALWFGACFWLFNRWAHLVQFNNQDTWMVGLTPETAPERLYRPDVSITSWRKLCENARREVDLTAEGDAGHDHLSKKEIPLG